MKHLLLAGLFVGLLIGLPAYADEQGVKLSPAVFEDKVDAGKNYPFTLLVQNVSSEEKTFYLVVRDVKSVDDAGRPEFATEGEPTPFNLSTWVSLPVESVTIPAGVERAVQFTVSVPADATPGAHLVASS